MRSFSQDKSDSQSYSQFLVGNRCLISVATDDVSIIDTNERSLNNKITQSWEKPKHIISLGYLFFTSQFDQFGRF